MTDASKLTHPLEFARGGDQLSLWRGVPMASGYSAFGIARAMIAALAKHLLTQGEGLARFTRSVFAGAHRSPWRSEDL